MEGKIFRALVLQGLVYILFAVTIPHKQLFSRIVEDEFDEWMKNCKDYIRSLNDDKTDIL